MEYGYPTMVCADFIPDSRGMETVISQTRASTTPETRFHTVLGRDGRFIDVKKTFKEPVIKRMIEEIDWNGDQDGRDILCRTKTGIAVINISSGDVKVLFDDVKFPKDSSNYTARAVDVIGDGREEILVVRDFSLYIYTNMDQTDKVIQSPWEDKEYVLRKYINHPTGL